MITVDQYGKYLKSFTWNDHKNNNSQHGAICWICKKILWESEIRENCVLLNVTQNKLSRLLYFCIDCFEQSAGQDYMFSDNKNVP